MIAGDVVEGVGCDNDEVGGRRGGVIVVVVGGDGANRRKVRLRASTVAWRRYVQPEDVACRVRQRGCRGGAVVVVVVVVVFEPR